MEIKLKTLLPEEQIKDKIDHGFHKALNKSEEEYWADFANALIKGKYLQEITDKNKKSSIVMIEPRIPFTELLILQGIDLDPAVFYVPYHYPKAKPYSVLTEIFPNQPLPASFRTVSPLEGIQTNYQSSLDIFSVLALPGGGYEKLFYAPKRNRARVLVLENYLGKCRMSHMYGYNTHNSVGIFGCWKGNKND